LRSDWADSILPMKCELLILLCPTLNQHVFSHTNAENWERLAWAATQSSKTDAVIQLVKNGDVRPAPTLAGVDKFVFEDIPTLFSTFMESPLADYQPRRRLNPNATVFIPRMAHTLVQEANQAGPTVTREQADESNKPRDGPDADGLFTNIHHDAARRIQLAYRRFRRRISARPRSHALNHWFKEYSTIGRLSQCSVAYRVVVLGPLPHLLVCANAFRRKLDEQKTHASKMMHTVNHVELEEAMARLHQIQ
jgi:hypothetical protein